MSVPAAFVGRKEELAALRDVVGLRPGSAVAVVVTGDPGSGKTRLLAEALAGVEGRRLLHVRGHETEAPVALAAAAPLLRELGALPEAGLAPFEPIQAFERAYRALASGGPAAIVVDDLQWVDDSSFALCQYLIRGAAEAAHDLAVVAASRPSPRVATFMHAVEDALPGRVRLLELAPFSREEGVALVRALAPQVDEGAATELWRQAGGLPFWLEALVDTRGAGVDARRLVTARLRDASGDAAELLALLTIVDRPVAPSALAELKQWPAERVDRAAAELTARGVALLGPASLRLTHDLTRKAALEELPVETRTRLHRRAAEWLEEQAADNAPLLREALEHRLAAGMPAAELALRIATGTSRRLVGSEGVHRLGAIADAERSVELHSSLATLACELGEHEVALRRAEIVAHAVEARERARWFLLASQSAYRLNRLQEARSFLEQARRHCDDPVLGVELDAHEAAIVRWLETDIDRARVFSDRAVRDARRLAASRPADVAAREALLHSLKGAFDAAMVEDEPTRLAAIVEEMLDVTREMRDEDHLRALLHVAISKRQHGQVLEAETIMRRVWAQANERVLPALAVETGYWLAPQLFARGCLAEADEVAAESAALAGRIAGMSSRMTTLPQVRSHQHVVAVSRGDWRQAITALEQAAQEEPAAHGRLRIHANVASLLARIDPEASGDAVVAHTEQSLADAAASGCRRCLAEIQLVAADNLARIGRREEAESVLRAYDSVPHEMPELVRFWRRRAEASLAAGRGDPRSAAERQERLAADAAALGLRLDALWAKIERGRVLAVVDPQGATQTLLEAVDDADGLGAKTEALVAEKLLRALGVRTWARKKPEGELTEREREIAQMVASGATNPEIARQLFLSRKTVERHVSNVLRKAGARNRAELAAWMTEFQREGVPR